MTPILNTYSKEELSILKTIAKLETPIIIAGKIGTGKRNLAETLKSFSDSRIIVELDSINLPEKLTKLKGSKDSLDQNIFLALTREGSLPSLVGPHIHITTFHVDGVGHYFRVSPQFKEGQLKKVSLSPEYPMLVNKVETGKLYSNTNKVTFTTKVSSQYHALPIHKINLDGKDGIKEFNHLLDSVICHRNKLIGTGLPYDTRYLTIIKLTVPKEFVTWVDTEELHEVTSHFLDYKIAVAIITDSDEQFKHPNAFEA